MFFLIGLNLNCMINGNDDSDHESDHDSAQPTDDAEKFYDCFMMVQYFDIKFNFSGKEKACEILTDFLYYNKTDKLYKFIIQENVENVRCYSYRSFYQNKNPKYYVFNNHKKIAIYFLSCASNHISLKKFGSYLNEFLSLYLHDKISFAAFSVFIGYFHDIYILDEEIEHFLIATNETNLSAKNFESSSKILNKLNEMYNKSGIQFEQRNDFELLKKMFNNYCYIRQILKFFKDFNSKNCSFNKKNYMNVDASQKKFEEIIQILESRFWLKKFFVLNFKIMEYCEINLELNKKYFDDDGHFIIWDNFFQDRVTCRTNHIPKFKYNLIFEDAVFKFKVVSSSPFKYFTMYIYEQFFFPSYILSSSRFDEIQVDDYDSSIKLNSFFLTMLNRLECEQRFNIECQNAIQYLAFTEKLEFILRHLINSEEIESNLECSRYHSRNIKLKLMQIQAQNILQYDETDARTDLEKTAIADFRPILNEWIGKKLILLEKNEMTFRGDLTAAIIPQHEIIISEIIGRKDCEIGQYLDFVSLERKNNLKKNLFAEESSDASVDSKAKIEQSFFAKIAAKFKDSTNWFGKLFFKFFSWLAFKFSS